MSITTNDVWLELSGLNKNIVYDSTYCESQIISQTADLTLDVSYFKTPINVTYKMNGTVIDSYIITTIGTNMHSLIDTTGITGVNTIDLTVTDSSPSTKTLKESITANFVSTVINDVVMIELSGLNKNLVNTCPNATQIIGQVVDMTVKLRYFKAPVNVTYKMNGTSMGSYVITTIGTDMNTLIDVSGITGVNTFELITTDSSPSTKTLKEIFTVDVVSTLCQPLICSLAVS